MLRNYILVAIRNLWRHRLFSGINVVGLAISMSICLLALSLLINQLSYDTFHEQGESIYRVTSERKEGEFSVRFATAPPPMAPALETQFSGIGQTQLIQRGLQGDLKANDKIIPVNGLLVSEGFFNFFSFELLRGDKATVLKEPFSVVLTEAVAKKFFGDSHAVGEVMSLPGYGDFTVTGIVQDPPANTHIQFEILASYSTQVSLENQQQDSRVSTNWNNLNETYVYFTLQPGTDTQSLVDFFNRISETSYTEAHRRVTFGIQPLAEITPSNGYSNQLSPTLPGVFLYFLGGIVIVVMLSACFNYTNLSIARALTRAREVGIRKTAGASRLQLFTQFMTEAIIIALLALSVAMFSLEPLKQAFLSILDAEGRTIIRFAEVHTIVYWFVLFAVITGFIAGAIPALMLSKFNPVTVLKSSGNLKLIGRLGMRKTLIAFQFMLSLMFIMTTLMVYQQFDFALTKDLGFIRDHILTIELQGNDPQPLKQALLQHKQVVSVSAAAYVPVTGRLYTNYMKLSNGVDSVNIAYMSADTDYLETLQLTLVAGNAMPEQPSDREQFILLNEHATKTLGYTRAADAVGQPVRIAGRDLIIAGVVQDFHYEPVSKPIGDFALRHLPDEFNLVNVKVTSASLPSTMQELEAIWKRLDPVHAFQCRTMDETINDALVGYRIIVNVIGYVSFLAISIACLGLLGMTIYVMQTRKKEVGIRKVLGATERELVVHLSRGFFLILMLAAAIAIPAAYWANTTFWIDHLAYKTNVGASVFLLSFAVVLVLGLITIGSQTWRAAKTNPVNVLRNE